MKKLVIGMFALCLTMGMLSCGNKAAGNKDGKDSAATEAQAEVKEEKTVDVNEVLAKAKAEGANWDEAQWKDAIKDMFRALSPMLEYYKSIEDRMKGADKGTDAEKAAAAAKIMEEVEAKQKEFEPMEKAMEEFNKIAEQNPIAKKLLDDKAFEEELKKEFNLPEDF
jgi:hypothetical protein